MRQKRFTNRISKHYKCFAVSIQLHIPRRNSDRGNYSKYASTFSANNPPAAKLALLNGCLTAFGNAPGGLTQVVPDPPPTATLGQIAAINQCPEMLLEGIATCAS